MVLEELDKNLVLYLPFSEGSGTKVFDRSQGQNNGVLNGAIFVKPYEDMSDDSDDEGDNPLVIIDDGGAAFWTLIAGVGTDDTGTVKKGANSYKTALTADLLDMYHDYGANQDWTQYDYLTIWIYGCNTADTITLYVYNEVYAGKTNGYSYAITDDYTGWKRFMIPLERFTNVAVPTGWNNVRCIELLGGAPQTCDYFFDRSTLDVGNWRFGEAMDFDGVNDIITIPHSSSLNVVGPHSVSVWYNRKSEQTSYRIILTKGSFTNDRLITFLQRGNDIALPNILQFQVGDGASFYSANTGTIAINEWHHYVGVYDGTYVKVFVDGKLIHKGTVTNPPCGNSDDVVLASSFLDCMIDELRIYNHALTPQEIRTLYLQSSRRG
jgi:hypothetical protein